MGLFRKKDPLSQRSRELKQEIAALEAKIKKLGSQSSESVSVAGLAAQPSGFSIPSAEPVFEDVEKSRLKSQGEVMLTEEHYNEFGLRKFDLPALLRRWQNRIHPRPVSNPKLVEYLAAGSIQGLRPLRYEKRIARNRFVVLTSILLLILWGLVAVFVRH